jgi:four helix bundle protein
MSDQAMCASTSIGANVEKARAAFTRAEFSYRVDVTLREAREVQDWLHLIKRIMRAPSQNLDALLNEAEEIMQIPGAIVRKSRKRMSVTGLSTN